ncbi:MAG: DUF362 domain-containing protein [Sedimentisphaerales bacterium]|nr:DUF362 domain-containing protein [Sedimentisphaerales bacterium]
MSVKQHSLSRRDLLKGLGWSWAAGTFGLAPGARAEEAPPVAAVPKPAGRGRVATYRKVVAPARVSLVKGNDARDNVYQALRRIEDEVVASIGAKKRILVKPNFVTTDRPLCATRVDAVRGILDFFRPRFAGEILIGESTASNAGTFAGYQNYGYLPLEKEYRLKLVDLNRQPYVYRYVFGKGHRPLPIRIIETFLDPDLYIISAAKMKTHDRVLTTLSLKNVLLAAPLNDYTTNDKGRTHTAYPFRKDTVLHYNLFHLAQEIYPDLGVIDGFEAMEGDGPVGGDPVDARLALASLDPLALDTLATKLMGFDPGEILYLSAMNEAGMGQGDLDKIQALGADVGQCQYRFKASRHLLEAYNLG